MAELGVRGVASWSRGAGRALLVRDGEGVRGERGCQKIFRKKSIFFSKRFSFWERGAWGKATKLKQTRTSGFRLGQKGSQEVFLLSGQTRQPWKSSPWPREKERKKERALNWKQESALKKKNPASTSLEPGCHSVAFPFSASSLEGR